MEAEAILRKCVHCGFCTATCPTYQLLGDDLDSPRGRIYLIKRALEGGPITERTRLHLDRCLTCRACETACPSGVNYGRLVDIGRAVVVESRTRRSPWDRMQERRARIRAAAHWRFLRPHCNRPAVRAVSRSCAPGPPPASAPGAWPARDTRGKMLALAGCVQPALAPSINAAAARVLDRLGISLVEAPGAGCCGALRFHLNYQRGGRDDMRALIDAWWPLIERSKLEAIVMTASGCGVTVKDYVHHFADDPDYRDKAARISALTKDLSEVVARSPPEKLLAARKSRGRVAFHSPCTLQHGQQIRGRRRRRCSQRRATS